MIEGRWVLHKATSNPNIKHWKGASGHLACRPLLFDTNDWIPAREHPDGKTAGECLKCVYALSLQRR